MFLDDLRQKVAYLQGLANGLQLGESGQERLLGEIIGVLGNFAESVEGMRDSHRELEEYLMEVDYDLSALEEEKYRRQEARREDEDEDDEGNEDDESFREVRCPRCGHILRVETGDGSGDEGQLQVICPNCGEVIYTEDDGYEHEPDDEEIIDHRQ